jgi:hypothetical protein
MVRPVALLQARQESLQIAREIVIEGRERPRRLARPLLEERGRRARQGVGIRVGYGSRIPFRRS